MPFQYKLKSMAIVVGGGVVGYAGVATVSGNEDFYRRLIMPAVHMVASPEQAHRLAIKMAKLKLIRSQKTPDDDVLVSFTSISSLKLIKTSIS